MLIADIATGLKTKLLYASILGIPVVKCAWLRACVAGRACVPMEGQLVWQAARPPERIFAGLSILLLCPPSHSDARLLLAHAGVPARHRAPLPHGVVATSRIDQIAGWTDAM